LKFILPLHPVSFSSISIKNISPGDNGLSENVSAFAKLELRLAVV
jgi:hypothetical protein